MDGNLIAVNIPNGVSIVIMAAIGGVLLGFARKAIKGKGGSAVSSGPVFTGS